MELKREDNSKMVRSKKFEISKSLKERIKAAKKAIEKEKTNGTI